MPVFIFQADNGVDGMSGMGKLIDDDKFTPAKHLTPPPHHSSRPAAAHTDTETPLQQKEG